MHRARGGKKFRVSTGSEGAKGRSTPRRVQKTRRIDRITDRADDRGPGRRPDVRSTVAAPGFEGFSRRRPAAGPASGSCVRTAARRCHPLPYAKVTDPSSWSLFGRGTVAATVCMSMARGSRDCLTQHGRRSTHLEGSCERTLPRLARRRRPRCDRVEIASLVPFAASEMS